MKPWMRVLIWFGLGTSFGFFVGQQVGYKMAEKNNTDLIKETYDEGYKYGRNDEAKMHAIIKENGYDGDCDGDIPIHHLSVAESLMTPVRGMVDIPEDDPVREVLTPVHPEGEDDDPEMPMEEPVIDDEPSDIPQFHPTFLAPQIVTQEEYDNRGDLDEKVLIYYEGDEVLYCVEDQKPIGVDQQPATIGIGTLNEFHVGPGPAKDEIYVINETYGRFKIMRVDDAFADAVDGNCGPEEDDYWDDV